MIAAAARTRSAVTLAAVAIACGPVAGVPRTYPPENRCPEHTCEAYQQDGVKPACGRDRCEAGKPVFPYVLVVSVPTTSFFGAGRTFYVPVEGGTPRSGGDPSTCRGDECIPLPPLVTVEGEYRASYTLMEKVGLPADPPRETPATFPARVVYRPLVKVGGASRAPSTLGIPEDPIVADRRVIEDNRGPLHGPSVVFSAVVPRGMYERTLSPDPPWDVLPIVTTSDLETAVTDIVVVRDEPDPRPPLEPVKGLRDVLVDERTRRLAKLARPMGLDGFRTWLADAKTQDRASARRTLSGFSADVFLDTVQRGDEDSRPLDLVLAPPEGSLAMPSLVVRTTAGQGMDQSYLDVPPPAAVTGRVVSPSGATPGVRATVVFDGDQMRLAGSLALAPYLKYRTSVRTDAQGRFATILPLGLYTVHVDPDKEQGWGKNVATVDVDAARDVVLVPSPLAAVEGRAILTDGRSLAGAEVIAAPSFADQEGLRVREPWRFPREVRTRTDDVGAFRLALDQGTYDITVVPADGTGLPATISVGRKIAPPKPGGVTVLEPLRVPAPQKISHLIVDPSRNPVTRAIVRAFAKPVAQASYVQIGTAMTDAQGKFELLVAGQPR